MDIMIYGVMMGSYLARDKMGASKVIYSKKDLTVSDIILTRKIRKIILDLHCFIPIREVKVAVS